MKTLRILLFMLIITTFILLGFLFQQHTGKIVYERELANLTRAVDGDTFDSSLGKVRMLGINTPEKKEAGYEEAKIYLQQFEGSEVELIRTQENKDKYGRLLRYVEYNSRLINEEILLQGLAHFYAYSEDEYTNQLKKAEEQAIHSGLGVWQKSRDECASCIILLKLNPVDPGEYVLLKNNCSFAILYQC